MFLGLPTGAVPPPLTLYNHVVHSLHMPYHLNPIVLTPVPIVPTPNLLSRFCTGCMSMTTHPSCHHLFKRSHPRVGITLRRPYLALTQQGNVCHTYGSTHGPIRAQTLVYATYAAATCIHAHVYTYSVVDRRGNKLRNWRQGHGVINVFTGLPWKRNRRDQGRRLQPWKLFSHKQTVESVVESHARVRCEIPCGCHSNSR